MTNLQRSEWIYQSSALSVFLMWVEALMTKKGMSLVSSVILQGLLGRIYSVYYDAGGSFNDEEGHVFGE